MLPAPTVPVQACTVYGLCVIWTFPNPPKRCRMDESCFPLSWMRDSWWSLSKVSLATTLPSEPVTLAPAPATPPSTTSTFNSEQSSYGHMVSIRTVSCTATR